MFRDAKRALRYPSLLLPELDGFLGRIRSKYEFGTVAQVSPRSRVRPPDRFSIGPGTTIYPHAVIKPKDPDGISLGRECTVHEFSFLSGSIAVGDGVRIANKVSIHSFDHGTDATKPIREQPLQHGRCVIEDDVWIGTNATVLKDVHIGQGAVVAAGSVVTRDVDPYTIVAGQPAEPVGSRG